MRALRLVGLSTVFVLAGCTALLGSFEVAETAATVDGGLDASAADDGAVLTDAADDATSGDAGCVAPASGFLDDGVQVAGGFTHSCAIRRDGSLWCWGDNAFGQLGVPTATTTESAKPVKVQFPNELGGARVAQVALGESVSYAVDSQQRLWSWGLNTSGELGQGSKDANKLPNAVPRQVKAPNSQVLPPVRAVMTMWYGACAVTIGGQVSCWGPNFARQLGPDVPATTTESPSAIKAFASDLPVPRQEALASLGIGASAACYSADGTEVTCWGGVFANATSNPLLVSNKPDISRRDVHVSLSSSGARLPIKALAYGTNYGAALDNAGQLVTWGPNNGTLIHGPGAALGAGTARVTPGSYRGLSASYTSLCVIGGQGVVRCRGQNAQGQLGRATPVAGGTMGPDGDLGVALTGDGKPLGPATTLGAGQFHFCAVMEGPCGPEGGGPVACWGQNDVSQLGQPSTTAKMSEKPVRVLAP